MSRYAFIDVPNTNGTTQNCHDFRIDYEKLYSLLTNNKWDCKTIFFYKGYKGEKEREQLEKVRNLGYIVQTKLTHIHPDKDKKISIQCDRCKADLNCIYTIKGNQKSNCDVELTVDVMETAKPGDEIMLLSGDGDFSYLIKKIIDKGIKVIIISSKKIDMNGNKRFSTRLSEIINKEDIGDKRVRFLNINNWKILIQKENRHEA